MTNRFRYFFSRKERAKRKRDQQDEQCASVQIPPAFKSDEYCGPQTANPRPLSSFAPDFSRQSQQYPRTSYEQPLPYQKQRLPVYDPSRYHPVAPTHFNTFSHTRGQSSRLNGIRYPDPSSSIYRPFPDGSPCIVSMGRFDLAAPAPRPQSFNSSTSARSAGKGFAKQDEGRERAISEPMSVATVQGTRNRPKPVLSRLITNLR